mmetsp:Transcript_14441/g.21704  ORF Transcript_14441/g.21704 Transcript_14441/m.21704 type:complete len:242 (+) Transcript_14441:43-768(+)
MNRVRSLFQRNIILNNVRGKRNISNFGRFDTNDGSALLYGIIGANTAVFFAWNASTNDRSLQRNMYKHFTLSNDGIFRHGRIHTLFTTMFSHVSLGHFLANMVTLYFFGSQALMVLGARQFMQLYFGGGFLSSICYVVWPDIIPKSWPARYQTSRYAPAMGASGAVSAAVAWSILQAPSSIVYLYMVVPIPAALFGLLYIGYESFGLYQGGTGTGNAAHLGGALYGAMYFLSKNRHRLFRR